MNKVREVETPKDKTSERDKDSKERWDLLERRIYHILMSCPESLDVLAPKCREEWKSKETSILIVTKVTK